MSKPHVVLCDWDAAISPVTEAVPTVKQPEAYRSTQGDPYPHSHPSYVSRLPSMSPVVVIVVICRRRRRRLSSVVRRPSLSSAVVRRPSSVVVIPYDAHKM